MNSKTRGHERSGGLRVGIFAQLLLAFLLVALLPLGLYWSFEHERIVESGTARAEENLLLFSERVVRQVDDWAEINLVALQVAAATPEMRSMDGARQQPVVDALAQRLPWSYLIHTADLSGMNVARSDRRPLVSYAFRRYHQDVVRGAPYSAEVQIGRTSRKPAFLLGVAIPGEGGRTAGVLIEAAALDEVTRAVASARFGSTGFAFLMSENGRLIAHPQETLDQDLMDYSAHPAYAAARSAREGLLRYAVGGVERLAALRRTQLGWIAVAQQDVAESLQAVHAANRFGLWLLAGTAALVTLLSAVIARSFARPIERVADVAGQIARGRLDFSVSTRRRDQIGDLLRAMQGTIRQIELNRGLLQATLEHLPQGVSVVDAELRLLAWNRRYLEIFKYPPGLVAEGVPIERLMRCNLERGLMGSGDGEAEIRRRLDHLRSERRHVHERELPDGTVLEIRGSPLPGVGYVTSFSDVSAYKRTEQELRSLTATLERRVAERTEALRAATAEAHRANRAKSRFLAAAVHDLTQPVTAARLYVSALKSDLEGQPQYTLAQRAEATLAAVEGVFAGLMDISHLESGKFRFEIAGVALRPLFESLINEFALVARGRGLRLDCVYSDAVVRSDPALLRRVLQNYLSNAIRYTRSGRVLLGSRRAGCARRIEVWDTGSGIPADKTAEIFEEFRRLDTSDRSEQGAGLGLAIVRNIARSLDHPIGVRSQPGRGSVFFIEVPLGQVEAARGPEAAPPPSDAVLQGLRVWCIDDDHDVRDSTHALLSRWGCDVTVCDSAHDALRRARRASPPDLLLLDYRLGDATGLELLPQLDRLWERAVPTLMITGEQPGSLPPQAHTRVRVLAKPLPPERLRDEVLRAVGTA